MYNYQGLLHRLLIYGEIVPGIRTGIATRSLVGQQLDFDLRDGFPLVTIKQTPIRLVITELLWMLSGSTKIRDLILQNNHIWNEWPFQEYLKALDLETEYPKYSTQWQNKLSWFVEEIRTNEVFANVWGYLGPVYGAQWRNYNGNGFDQIQTMLDLIKNDPTSRRILVSAWNPLQLSEMALPPCHYSFQVFVREEFLDMVVTIRSWDLFLGAPFNIASYATLLMMLSQVSQKTARKLTIFAGDAHIYENHVQGVQTAILRKPYPLPTLKINPKIQNLFDFKIEDFTLENYTHHPKIAGEVAV